MSVILPLFYLYSFHTLSSSVYDYLICVCDYGRLLGVSVSFMDLSTLTRSGTQYVRSVASVRQAVRPRRVGVSGPVSRDVSLLLILYPVILCPTVSNVLKNSEPTCVIRSTSTGNTIFVEILCVMNDRNWGLS